jgi:iron complex outermembrane receptor protein
VAGVINYIVRKNYNGAEITGRLNNNNGGAEFATDITLGKRWDGLGSLGGGNLLISYGYTHRDPVIAGKNPYLRKDGRPVGASDRRLSGSSASNGFFPNIVVDRGTSFQNLTIPAAGQFEYYGLPTTGSNVGLTVGQLRLNDPSLVDAADFTDFLGRSDRHQVAVFFNQELGDRAELFFQGNYINRKTVTRTLLGTSSSVAATVAPFLYVPDATVTTGATPGRRVTTTPNPLYISGIPGVPAGGRITTQYAALRDFGASVYEGSDESYNLTAGVRVDIFGGWKGEAFYTYGRNKGCSFCVVNGYINTEALQYQVDIGAINPLSNVPLTAAQRATFSGRQSQFGYNGIDDAVIKFNGPLFALPAGTVRAAVGVERLKQYNYNENTSVAGINNTPRALTSRASSYYDRTIKSAFGELYVPLIGDDMGVPLIKSLTASAAVRHDDYSDSGKTTNPKFGLTWEVADFLSLSGTWGTSFVAPSITDKNPGAFVSGALFPFLPQVNVDPRFQACALAVPGLGCLVQLPFAQNVAVLFGSNPALQPQTSENWTLSAEFKPGGGFRANVNYYNISYKNRIVFPATLGEFLAGPTPGSSPPSYRGYERYIIPINNPATCVNSNLATADPVLQALLARPIYAGATPAGLAGFQDFCGIRAFVDSRFTNLASTKTDGLDIDVSWTGSTGDVVLTATAAANVILSNNERVDAGAPTVSRINTQSTPVRWRGRGSVGAAWNGFSSSLFLNYIGPITNTGFRSSLDPRVAPTNRSVPSYTTFDLNLSYGTDFAGRSAGVLKGLRGSVTILNLFDRDPQVIDDGFNSYIAGRSPLWGRTVSFQITGSF